MSLCSSCGKETDGNKKICASCMVQHTAKTWKRQMRLYSVIALIGIIMFFYAVGEIKALPHDAAAAGIPPILMWTAALGGLGILGGLFGLALAWFFNFLHRNK
ncbi:MAG: hypothetical protein R8K50_00140 [Mariprofundus sp.]